MSMVFRPMIFSPFQLPELASMAEKIWRSFRVEISPASAAS